MANEQEGDDSYRQLVELEELESLLEEVEEAGLDSGADWGALPEELREQLASLGVGNMSELVARISFMHAELDEQ
ncbi:MAG TPA: hypothetical protein VFH60_09600 [Chloroflexia bacterium]|nr:hypothetical protein [Chloroflexia bacterium]